MDDKHGPLQGSASFGECENVGPTGAILDGRAWKCPGDQILEQAAAEGRTLFSSTGDTGAFVPDHRPAGARFWRNGLDHAGLIRASTGRRRARGPSRSAVPTSAVTATRRSSRFTESAWEYGGGGNSTSEPAGSYQTGVASTNCPSTRTVIRTSPSWARRARSAARRRTSRSSPATSRPATVFSINDDSGADSQGAGTSLCSPLWLGVRARIQAAAKNKGLGFANYAIYKLAPSSGGRDFYDVTVGDNLPYPAKPGYDNTTGWGTPEISQIMHDLDGRLTPTHNALPAPIVTTSSTTCGNLFTDPAGDDAYAPEGESLNPPGSNPQLDILSGRAFLSSDRQTLRTIITVNNMSTAIPLGGGENDYQLVFTFGGKQYFTQLAVELSGTVLAWDGELVHLSLENKYLQEHSDPGTITLGPNGTAEVDAPLSDFPGMAAGATLLRPSAATYVREGVTQGSLQPADSAGPTDDDLLGVCSS